MSATRIAELATLIQVLKREAKDLEPRLATVKKTLEDAVAELLELQPARQPKPEAADEVTGPVLDANGLRTDGPTVQEYVDHGYLATGYPPSGYASRSTPEEVAVAIAAQNEVHTAGGVATDPTLPAGTEGLALDEGVQTANLDASQSAAEAAKADPSLAGSTVELAASEPDPAGMAQPAQDTDKAQADPVVEPAPAAPHDEAQS